MNYIDRIEYEIVYNAECTEVRITKQICQDFCFQCIIDDKIYKLISTKGKNMESKLKNENTLFVHSNVYEAQEHYNIHEVETFRFSHSQFCIFKEIVEKFNQVTDKEFVKNYKIDEFDENVLTVGKLLELLQNVHNKNAVVSFFDENNMDSYSFDGFDLDKSKKFATIKIKL